MTVVLALLLVVGLPQVETNVTVSGKQSALRCHVCEKENNFECVNPEECPQNVQFCSTVAVRIFPRFFYVSKQCSSYCPITDPHPGGKSFVLLKPTPFLYARCCRGALCNTHKPEIKDQEERFKEAGRASDPRSSSAGLLVFLPLTSASLGLRLP